MRMPCPKCGDPTASLTNAASGLRVYPQNAMYACWKCGFRKYGQTAIDLVQSWAESVGISYVETPPPPPRFEDPITEEEPITEDDPITEEDSGLDVQAPTEPAPKPKRKNPYRRNAEQRAAYNIKRKAQRDALKASKKEVSPQIEKGGTEEMPQPEFRNLEGLHKALREAEARRKAAAAGREATLRAGISEIRKEVSPFPERTPPAQTPPAPPLSPSNKGRKPLTEEQKQRYAENRKKRLLASKRGELPPTPKSGTKCALGSCENPSRYASKYCSESCCKKASRERIKEKGKA